MGEHIEVETDKLREHIAEATEKGPRWISYVALSAAIFAVVAAISALRSGDLINEATLHQIRASDAWNEYQSSRSKQHIYTVAADILSTRVPANAPRLRAYHAEINKEIAKEKSLAATARKLEADTATEVERHHSFEYAVALLQVGIALGAVAALTRSLPAFYISLAAGFTGFFFFVKGLLT